MRPIYSAHFEFFNTIWLLELDWLLSHDFWTFVELMFISFVFSESCWEVELECSRHHHSVSTSIHHWPRHLVSNHLHINRNNKVRGLLKDTKSICKKEYFDAISNLGVAPKLLFGIQLKIYEWQQQNLSKLYELQLLSSALFCKFLCVRQWWVKKFRSFFDQRSFFTGSKW